MKRIKPSGTTPVVLIGDTATGANRPRLDRLAQHHGFSVEGACLWEEGGALQSGLADIPVIAAMLADGPDGWLPYPEDLAGPLQMDVLATALAWRGRRLLVGQRLAVWEPGTYCAMSRVLAEAWSDLHALAVAACAAAAAPTLFDEVIGHLPQPAPPAPAARTPWQTRLLGAVGATLSRLPVLGL